MSPSAAKLDPAKIRAVADQLSRSAAGRALLDGLTEARLGRLDDMMDIIVEAIETARDEVRQMKSAWHNSGANKEDIGALAARLEQSDATILEATRRLRIMTMGLREGGVDRRISTLIDQQVTHVLVACEGNEYSAEELGRMAGMLGALEGSISRLTGARPPRPATGPGRESA